MNTLKTPLVTVLFIFLCLFLFTKLAGPIPFAVTSVTTAKDSLFTVEGQGEVTAIPDTALISLGVTKKAATVQDAQSQVNTIINQMTKDLKALGVEEKNIKTTNYSVNPEYDYTSGKQTLNGYTVNANIEVKVLPIDKANKVVDTATKDGANQVGNIQFVLNDAQQKNLENQARKEAIQNAKDKAATLSQEAGIKLGRIIDVKETSTPAPRPVLYNAMEKSADTASAPTDLNPGENKVTISVSLSYETF
jgi:uncharacterized protein YggE